MYEWQLASKLRDPRAALWAEGVTAFPGHCFCGFPELQGNANPGIKYDSRPDGLYHGPVAQISCVCIRLKAYSQVQPSGYDLAFSLRSSAGSSVDMVVALWEEQRTRNRDIQLFCIAVSMQRRGFKGPDSIRCSHTRSEDERKAKSLAASNVPKQPCQPQS